MFLILLGLVVLLGEAYAQKELLMVHALWRHGARTPVHFINEDTRNTEESWPEGVGELIPKGIDQQVILGDALRKRYQEDLRFITSTYIQNEIYVRSTDYNRTLMSAYANLVGFYSRAPKLTTNTSLPGNWQPIPVHTVAKDNDYVLWMNCPCPKYDVIMNSRVYQQESYHSNMREFQSLFSYLERNMPSAKRLALSNMWKVYDPLKVEQLVGRRWPPFINQSIFDQILNVHGLSTLYLFSDEEVRRLRGSALIGEIALRMVQKRTSLENRNRKSLRWIRNLKYYAYSAHDMTVLAILEHLGAVQLAKGRMPGLSSCLLFELWRNGNEYSVSVFYSNGDDTNIFIPVPVRGCSSTRSNECLLNDFYDMVKDRAPTDWHAECSLRGSAASKSSMLGLGSMLLTMIVVHFMA